MTDVFSMQDAITQWFESDFKESARATTRTSRLSDGRLSYSFSVVNNSGFDFDKFSFRIKVINKDNGSEIGTASIKAGEWACGETKTFKSKLNIPEGVKSLSFVMYANSLDFEARPGADVRAAARDAQDVMGEVGDAFRGVGDAVKQMGDFVSGDGSGGIFGELFGTGGMPGGTTTTKTTTTTTSFDGTTTTKTTTTTRKNGSAASSRTSGNTGYSSSRNGSFSQRRNEKKLNKKRLGKSGWTMAALVMGVLLIIASFADSNTQQEVVSYLAGGGACLAAAGILKLALDSRAKRIRAYEARVNQNGNTSIDDLAAYVKKPYNKVCDDLQQMIADGFFPEAYIDMDRRLLVMTRDGRPIEDVERSAAENKKAKRKAAHDGGAAPETLDDLITMTDDAEIKSRLKSLRAVTKKIDRRVEEVPDLEKQVKDFREKYYPEVVRLTDEYNDKIADLGKYGEEQKAEVSSDSSGAPVINTNPNYLAEQADEIKKELITLIDSVTEASENLLERLHEDDIMDITTDIKKLQTTLASKGLLDSDFDIK